MDADFSVSFSRLYNDLKDLDFEALIYSRYLNGSSIQNERPLIRRFFSKLAKMVVKPFIYDYITDTQCGMKIFKRDIVIQFIDNMVCDRWLFDVELLYLFKLRGINVKELPCIWHNIESESTLNVFNALKTSVLELVRLYFNTGTLREMCKYL